MKGRLLTPALLASLCVSPLAFANVNLNGFASVGVGFSDEDGGALGYDKDYSFDPDSLVAVQIGYEINDRMSATVQLLARGADDWDPEMEWAYLSYEFDNGTLVRGGKLRMPLYMYSDYLDVRYAQPFLRPPAEVYDIVALSSYTGVDVVLPFEAGDSTITLQAFAGNTSEEADLGTATIDFDMKNLVGANLSWEWGDVLARVVYAQGDLEADPTAGDGLGSLFDDKKGTFAGVGLRYDPGSWFVLGEYGAREIDDEFSDVEGAYFGGGVRINAFTPYIFAGFSETTDDDDRAGPFSTAFDFERKSVSAGLRWDFYDNVAAKFDVSHYYDFNNTDGGFGSTVLAQGLDELTVFGLSVDAAF